MESNPGQDPTLAQSVPANPDAADAMAVPIEPTVRNSTGIASSEPGIRVVPLLSWYLPIKSIVETVLAVVLLVLSSPLIIAGAILVKLTSRGPAFYVQQRLGKDGREFPLYKLRTMICDAESGTGPVWAKDDDERVTSVGNWLRESHVDELPQLINVILQQMSLVGPRPERAEFAARLEFQLQYYFERLNVLPGMTGLAQLRLPPDTDLQSVRRKLIHDLYYVHHTGPWLDFRILVATAWLLVKIVFDMFWRRIRIPRESEVCAGVREVVGDSWEPILDDSDSKSPKLESDTESFGLETQNDVLYE